MTHGTEAPRSDEAGTLGFLDAEAAAGVVIVGGGHTGRRLAEQSTSDHSVHHVDELEKAVDVDELEKSVGRATGYEASHAPDVTVTAALAAT